MFVLIAVGEDVIGDLPDSWVSRPGTYAIGCKEGMVRKTTDTGLLTIYIFDPSKTGSPRSKQVLYHLIYRHVRREVHRMTLD